ncbi:hypothetical protein QCA50_013169 [Cerrena zonata]|uniref:CUE domain-containing protein n=1 Tax=Cerrena zonata TaxID=2478898 RepID=A0AAW0G1K3_9APHY
MFQVASRPAPPHLASNMETHGHYPTQVPSSLQLPRSLQRPTFSEVSRDFIVQLAPELQDVPLEYIRKHLAGQSNEMLAALNLLTLPSSLPRSHLTNTLDVAVRPANPMPSSNAFPTHVLAISSSRSSPSSPTTPTVASFAVQVAAGAAPATLLAALLPVLASSFPSASSIRSSSSSGSVYVSQFTAERLSRLANNLAASAYQQAGAQGALPILMNYAKVVNAFWRNVCALGVFDAELWGVMDLAWEIILGALTIVAQRTGGH